MHPTSPYAQLDQREPVDESGVGCDVFVHLIFAEQGMFCPCVTDAAVQAWFDWLRGRLTA